MPVIGSELAGYSVDALPGSIRVTAWGFWDAEVAGGFAKNVVDACRAARGAFRVVIDARELKPQREAGQTAFRALFRGVAPLAREGAELIAANAITRMQIMRIAKETGAQGWSFVAQDTPDAAAPGKGG